MLRAREINLRTETSSKVLAYFHVWRRGAMPSYLWSIFSWVTKPVQSMKKSKILFKTTSFCDEAFLTTLKYNLIFCCVMRKYWIHQSKTLFKLDESTFVEKHKFIFRALSACFEGGRFLAIAWHSAIRNRNYIFALWFLNWRGNQHIYMINSSPELYQRFTR